MRRLGMLAIFVVLAACGEAPPTPEPTLPPPPGVPDGWRTISTDEGDVTLTVPPHLVNVHTAKSTISGSRDPDDGPEALGVMVIGPGQLGQPKAGQSLAHWIQDGGWPTSGQDDAAVREVREREGLLPAGPSLELTTGYRVDGEVRWSIIYAISTEQGHALLFFGGLGQAPDEVSDEVGLMRDLVAFDR